MVIEDILDARILAAVAERRAFGAAAEALGVPAATLSRRVARMERAAGLRLFERTTRRVEVTEAGALAVERARTMVEAAVEIDDALDEARATPRGTVRVSAMHDMAVTLLAGASAEFLQRYPDCELAISLHDEWADLVRDGIDVAIRAFEPGGQGIVARKLGTVRLALHARPEVAARIGGIEDLRRERLGFFGVANGKQAQSGLSHSLSVHENGEERVEEVPAAIKVNDFALLRVAAIESDLVVGLPLQVARADIAEGRLARVLSGFCHFDVELFAVMPSRRHMRPAVRAFIDLAARHMRATLADGPDAVGSGPGGAVPASAA